MRKPSDTNRRSKISEIRPMIQKEIDELGKEVTQMSNTAFEYRQQALQHKQRGDVEKAKQAIRMHLTYGKLADKYMQQLERRIENLGKMNTINHKLFLRSMPSVLTKNLVNDQPNVNPNNTSLEQMYSRKYFPVESKNENTNTNTNSVTESQGCLRNAFGRCIQGIKARFTKKNKNKQQGGKKRGKSLKQKKRALVY